MISNAKLFPSGPYTYCRDKDGCDDVWLIYAAGADRPITGIPFWGDKPEWQARAEATARLFAAAPALLEALCLANKWLELTGRNGYTSLPAAKQIREAIESATGWVITSSEVDYGDRGSGPRTVGNALSRVLGHFIFEEQADFEQATGNTARKHIFHDLRVLNDWLKLMGYGSYL
jgi:hypothetical protein